MANTPLLLASNYASRSTTVIKSPVPVADPNYPVANIKSGDRTVVWSCPPGGGDVTLYLDIGAGHTTTHVGLLGYQTALFPNTWGVQAENVFPFDGSVVNITPMLQPTARDVFYALPAPVTYRYWGITLYSDISGFTLAAPLIGQFTDLGVNFSPTSTEDFVRQRVRNVLSDGTPSIAETGLPRRHFVWYFLAAQQAVRDALFNAAAVTPGTLIDWQGRMFQYELTGDLITHTNTPASGTPLYDVTFDVTTLP